MGRNTVKVSVRIRPTQHFARENIQIDHENVIRIAHTPEEESSVLNNKQTNFRFTLHHVFHNASQQAVYNSFARNVVQGAVDGVNGTIFSYGQTGSGKTFTMIGDTQNYDHRGIAPRALGHIFSEIMCRIEVDFVIFCTYMEIYNERIFDLLGDLSEPDQAKDFTIVEDKDGKGTHARGLSEVPVTSEEEALNLLFRGELSRTTAQHKLNRRSNRSHSIFTIYIKQKPRSGVREKITHSKLHLVDLAGSERLKKTLETADGPIFVDDTIKKESMCINQSLSYLEQCVVALNRKNPGHVPYRQSKLTTILKDSLGGNSSTLMLACIWGEAAHLEETVSTLRFAQRMTRVQNELYAVEILDSSQLLQKQDKQIRALKQELLMHDAMAERAAVEYDPYTPEQRQTVREMIERYVQAGEDEEEEVLMIRSYRHVLEICKQFKVMLKENMARARSASYLRGAMDANGQDSNSFDPVFHDNDELTRAFSPHDDALVGEFDAKRTGGFSLGVSNSSRPSSVDSPTKYKQFRSPIQASGAMPLSPITVSKQRPISLLDVTGDQGTLERERVFQMFKNTHGSDLNMALINSRKENKELKDKAKLASDAVNESKAEIDSLHKQIEERKANRLDMLRASGIALDTNDDDIVDEEEFRLMKQLRQAKRHYRVTFEELQTCKKDLQRTQGEVEAKRKEVVDKFQKWEAASTSPVYAQRALVSSPLKSAARTDGGMDASEDLSSTRDELDDQEAFEKLEMDRILAKDPESVAFFQAQKTCRAHMTQNASTIRQIHMNKRLH